MRLWDSEVTLDMFGQGIQIQGDRDLRSDILDMCCASQHDAKRDGTGRKASKSSTWSTFGKRWHVAGGAIGDATTRKDIQRS